MDARLVTIAKSCLEGAHDDTLSFPQIIGRLAEAGFEGYHVDFRANCQTYYLQSGDTVTLQLPTAAEPVAEPFGAEQVVKQVRLAQAEGPDYSYDSFCNNVRAAGCAGYLASIVGRRVLYYGRTAEIQVEHFPK